MNIRDFFWAYVDIWVESNKGSLATQDQCIDLWRAYNRKVIRAPDIFGNPPDIWAKYQQDFYEKIPNTPDGVPQLGDVIIWGTRYGKYGHIAICTEIANTKTFTSFDQNDPIGSACHFQPHTYTGVLGWLRPKNQTNIQDVNVQDQVSDLEDKIKSLAKQLETKELEMVEAAGKIRGLENLLDQQKADNEDLGQQILKARSERDTAIREREELAKKVENLEKQANELKEGLDSNEEEIKRLKTALRDSQALKFEAIGTWDLAKELFKRFLHRRRG